MDDFDGYTLGVLHAMIVQTIIYALRTVTTMVEVVLVAEGTIRASQLAPEPMFRS